MKKVSLAAIVVLGLALNVPVSAGEAAGPPAAVAYKKIVDPPEDAERHIVVKAEDRGAVWLYTGFLNNWRPDMGYELIARLAPGHWRYGLWPFWHPSAIAANPRPRWGDMRDSPEWLGEFMEEMMRLQAGGMTWQMIVHHKGRYYGRFRITKDMLEDFYDHIYTLVKYCRAMGAPFDYYEICNEPGVGPHEGVEGYGFRGTWEEFLGMWDTAHRAIRDAYPEAKIVGPSYGSCSAAMMEPFLAHCREKGQTLDVLSWHEISQGKVKFGPDYKGANVVEPDKAHKNIMDVRRLVEEKYGDLGIREYHIDEWGYTVQETGPGTQIAYFYYFDLAGVDRAAKAHWTQGDLDGILVSAKTPRTSYWCWAEYAKQKGGVRLATETDDRCVVALASRHDEAREMRVLVARSKRHTGEESAQKLSPANVKIDIGGVPLRGKAEVTIRRLGPHDGPMWEEEFDERATTKMVDLADSRLSLSLADVAENEVISILVGPEGTREKEKAADAQWTKVKPDEKGARGERELHKEATAKAREAAGAGTIRIACGAALAFTDAGGNGWFADREYEDGKFGYVGGGTVHRGPIGIEGTENPEVYRGELWGMTSYHITLANGKYLLRLHWAETYGLGAGGRTFDVVVEGKTILKDFDATREAGGRKKAVVREIEVEVTDGVLDFEFPHKEGVTPMINGIEVIRK